MENFFLKYIRLEVLKGENEDAWILPGKSMLKSLKRMVMRILATYK